VTTENNSTRVSRRSRANGEGSVYEIRNRNRWGASIKNFLGVRISKSFATKDETRICRFDPPFKPGFLQYNEIVIPVYLKNL
jgi:hypothetical protein